MFPETIPVAHPLREPSVVPHPQWISGFTSGFISPQCLSGSTSNDSGELSHLVATLPSAVVRGGLGELSHLRETCEIPYSQWLAISSWFYK